MEVVLLIRLILIHFKWPWERKPCQLIRFTFYSHAQWHDKTGKFIAFTGLLIVVVVVVFISILIHKLVSTAINVYNTDIMES